MISVSLSKMFGRLPHPKYTASYSPPQDHPEIDGNIVAALLPTLQIQEHHNRPAHDATAITDQRFAGPEYNPTPEASQEPPTVPLSDAFLPLSVYLEQQQGQQALTAPMHATMFGHAEMNCIISQVWALEQSQEAAEELMLSAISPDNGRLHEINQLIHDARELRKRGDFLEAADVWQRAIHLCRFAIQEHIEIIGGLGVT